MFRLTDFLKWMGTPLHYFRDEGDGVVSSEAGPPQRLLSVPFRSGGADSSYASQAGGSIPTSHSGAPSAQRSPCAHGHCDPTAFIL